MHLHALVTDDAFEERGGEVRFIPASTPTPTRLTAVLAQVHKTVPAVTGCLEGAWNGRLGREGEGGDRAQAAVANASGARAVGT